MTLAYLPYLILLAISPILGMYALKFAHPDVKTYVKSRQRVLFIIFGLAAYIPAAVIALLELVVPIYSPLGPTPALFESEGNVLFMTGVFLGALVINASVVDFMVVRRKKTTIVGVPKHFIAYGVKQQIVENKKVQTSKDISKITGDLESMNAGEDVKELLDRIRVSVAKEKARVAKPVEERPEVFEIVEKATERPKPAKALKELERPAGKSEFEEMFKTLKKAPEEKPVAPAKKKAVEEIIIERPGEVVTKEPEGITVERPEIVIEEKPPEEAPKEVKRGLLGFMRKGKAEKAEGKGVEKSVVEETEVKGWVAGEKAPSEMPTKVPEREISETSRKLKEALASGFEVPPEEEPGEDKEKLMRELETRLQRTTKDVEKRERTQELIAELKGKLAEDSDLKTKSRSIYPEDDVEEITRSLRMMKEEPKAAEGGRHGRPKKEPDEDIGASLMGYERSYPRAGDTDMLKAVVGDVRQQLTEKTTEGGEPPAGKRWYERELKEAPPGGAETGEVEFLEEGLSFGEGMGDLGELGDFGELGELENIDQNLESSEFDGMFVDLGKTKGGGGGGCPNCGKKGTSVVYCSSCGKPLCSNCATSVEGSEDFVKYKCPHCSEEFAMKKRLQA